MTLYATYFDSNFLVRGIAALRSLVRHAGTSPRALVLALDDRCADVLRAPEAVPGLTLEVMTIGEMEARYPSLREVRPTRSAVEYYFTLTPFLCEAALERVAPGERAVYMDADLFFFADPEPAVRAPGQADITVVEHRFPDRLRHLADAYGRFNVGWLTFASAPAARVCIDDWKRRCLDWCGDQPDVRGFADQKYLEHWPVLTDSLTVLEHPGVNLAPWNVARFHLALDAAGQVTVDGQRLIVFHFHRFQRIATDLYEADYAGFGRLPRVLTERIYGTYVPELAAIEREVLERWGWAPEGRLVRFARRFRSLRDSALYLLSVWRLLTGERVLMRGDHSVGILRSLKYV